MRPPTRLPSRATAWISPLIETTRPYSPLCMGRTARMAQKSARVVSRPSAALEVLRQLDQVTVRIAQVGGALAPAARRRRRVGLRAARHELREHRIAVRHLEAELE